MVTKLPIAYDLCIGHIISSSTPGPPCCACPEEAAHCNNGLCTASAEAGGDSLHEEEVNKTGEDGPDGKQIILFGTTVTKEDWRLDCPPSTTQASTTAVATAAPPANPAPTTLAATPAPGKALLDLGCKFT